MIGMVSIARFGSEKMNDKPAPAAHRDNLFGICHALGETFGFNPLVLRIVLLAAVMANAEATLIAYFSAGIAVLIAKIATRNSRNTEVRKLALTKA